MAQREELRIGECLPLEEYFRLRWYVDLPAECAYLRQSFRNRPSYFRDRRDDDDVLAAIDEPLHCPVNPTRKDCMVVGCRIAARLSIGENPHLLVRRKGLRFRSQSPQAIKHDVAGFVRQDLCK